MKKKEFIEHYNNILNLPDIRKHPEKEDGLKDEIQKLADIDKISYPLALDKIYNVFFTKYLWTDPDDSNFRDIEKAIINLSLLRHLKGYEILKWRD